VEDFKRKWEEWYGDLMAQYQWNELEYEGEKVLYVSGTALIDIDGRTFVSNVLQVIGYIDSDKLLDEAQQKEIAQLLKNLHGAENISFWPG
jgi:hypothetical protein